MSRFANKTTIVQLIMVAVVALLMIQPVNAQEPQWPPKSIEVVMPHRVESNHNAITREFCEVWNKHMGGDVDFKYVNKGGAAGRVGYDYFVEQAKGDGSFLLSSNIITGAAMYSEQEPKWDWMEELHAIGLFAMEPGVFMVRDDSKWESLEQVIEAAKEKPILVGTSRYVQGETLQLHQIMEETGAQFQIIPFGSGGATRAAVMGGHVDMASRKSTGIKKAGGELRALSISQDENIVPEIIGEDVPTTSEALGFETINVGSYRTFFINPEIKKNYPEYYEKLQDTFKKAKNDPKYIERAEKQGYPEETMIDPSPERINEMINKQFELFERFREHYK